MSYPPDPLEINPRSPRTRDLIPRLGWTINEPESALTPTQEAARYREALRLLVPTGGGGFVVIDRAEYESVKALVDEVQEMGSASSVEAHGPESKGGTRGLD